ncbi:hypothetical protein P154DRAFT_174882 [Amniculicola lignicola CBS 123094]|uniref:Uncharacterized protein n=1 Tax=Amniculicola lignicola CBS 123094 TaxID=1392246 RepID=A0A6A5WJM9_9PLEO|nr:hypothetical protein P154DRAFT_174882 [Amniculicola lignicola CBS 123094]
MCLKASTVLAATGGSETKDCGEETLPTAKESRSRCAARVVVRRGLKGAIRRLQASGEAAHLGDEVRCNWPSDQWNAVAQAWQTLDTRETADARNNSSTALARWKG